MAIAQALLVTLIWSFSWVLIRIGLDDIPPLPFAGLRYFLAFLILLPLIFRNGHAGTIRKLNRQDWFWLTLLGVVFYSLNQGLLFVSLDYLTHSVTLSLLLNLSAIVVAFMGVLFLKEYLTRWQWIGIVIFFVGVIVYFHPIPDDETKGLIFGVLTMLATAVASIIGRYVNREEKISAIVITVVSMGIGSVLLLVYALITEGMPKLTVEHWVIIIVLAAVNTAFAFTLWNHTLRTLTATQSNVINNTMLIQIAVLAWLFLDESITFKQIVGLALVGVGTLMVQLMVAKNSLTLPSLSKIERETTHDI